MLKVQGQSRALAQLQRSLAAGRLASTWIFAGPLGVGKYTLAMELARTVMCDSPVKEKKGGRIPQLGADFVLTLPCGICESCRAMASGGHPDLHIITRQLIRYHDKTGKSKGTTLSIDVIRGEITGDQAEGKEAKIAKRAFRGRGKFFIIDEADLMEGQAQNALLKTLEEPPPETYLVLVTTSPGELLSTIRSRAQLVEFGELPDAVMVPALAEAGLAPADAALLGRLARGSLGRALKWIEDMRVIEKKNAEAAARAEMKKARAGGGGGDGDEDEITDKFTPGGILAWARELGAALDGLVAGRNGASDVAAVMAKFAAEFAGLALVRDPLASADRAKRDGIQLLMALAAEWFADRLRQGLGTPYTAALPGESGALDQRLVPELIASARQAEWQIDMNANDKILLAATTTRWEQLLRES
jgi:hypothetical protein